MKKKHLLFTVAPLALLSVLAIWFFSRMAWVYDLKSIFPKAEAPELYLIPQPLRWSEPSPVKSSLTNSTCMLSTPWEFPPEIMSTSTNMTVYSFSNGVRIIVWAESSSLMGVDSLQTGGGELFNKDPYTESKYSFLKNCLNSSPDQISAFKPTETTLQNSCLLLLKSSVLSTGSTYFEYNIDGRTGFQLGDPTTDRCITLICFTSPNEAVELVIVKTETSEIDIGQSDINCIIESLKINANHH
ncbi:hypothetical protein [Tichowtungia aerotolerans]|uniref:Uncharacterized protein n=1 Tax=Tichowtungia aerotolerans TaxID=2697043 RepID=A0A6P1M4F7_9BACT|nr:hypothetical protein [Tichowtungia aerotolerans]QHI68727.1 hypothetical protein GT409_04445 [Tichowtungia aerotolerans]